MCRLSTGVLFMLTGGSDEQSTFKLTVILDSFKHITKWLQHTAIFTVSFTVSVQYALLVTGRRTPADDVVH